MHEASPVRYTGKSEYCYSNSLNMVLSAVAPDDWTVPDPGFLECLTTMPFGETFLDLKGGPLFFCSPAVVNPESGLDRAVSALGWKCDVWRGARTSSESDLLGRLSASLKNGPILAGPLDLGELPHNPRSRYLRGGDHFVAVLSANEGGILFHDPFGYPYVRLPVRSFLRGWRADRIPYRQGPYGLRSNFWASRPRTRLQSLRHVAPLLAKTLVANPGGPRSYGGLAALERLIDTVKNSPPRSLTETLTYFSLPLGARRRTDAARFMVEASNPQAARLLDQQARVLGGVQLDAVRGSWIPFAQGIDRFACMEAELADELRHSVPGTPARARG